MKFNSLIIRIFWSYILIFICISNGSIARGAPDVWDVLRSEFTLSHEITRPEVQEQIRWLVAHPSYLNKVSRQSEPYIYHVVGEIKKRKLPGELALIPMVESAYDPFVYSGAGAAGLWQLMPKTGSELGLKQDWWFDGRRSIRPSTDAALNYLLYLNKFFKGNWILAIAAYDCGEGTIARALKSTVSHSRSSNFWNLPVPRETKLYVPRLLALAEIIKNPGRYKVSLPSIPYLPYFEEVNIGSQIDLNHAAKLAGISYTELKKLNPGYNRWTTTPYKPFKLLIPTEKVERFNLNLSNMPEDQRVSWPKHQVQKGDSLDSIAARYNTTVKLIKQLNQLTTNSVKPNQAILIPSNKKPLSVAKREAPAATSLPYQLSKTKNQRVIHTVKATDTYQKIQNTYGVTIKEIKSWNKLTTNKPLRSGQHLVIWKKVKQPAIYIVKRGDSLSLIAKQHQTKVNSLLHLNPGLGKNKTLRLGQKILVG
ncbi:LysM peptidoglycan-binding domain-containing protein [Legionella sp. km535]|uniref:lytic transglycosylase n=1 Tax=Legionella sp. km535 TaxID=2498107 RepID=UPI000F8E45EB|nr:LysM peptidoglycan-binding domain-containing protein [Legionella sp. km535]RUR15684.1 LysM peptidoglycan-binding domain-containing protein [Legionella sp. km535]